MRASDGTHRPVLLYSNAGQRVVEVKVPRDLVPGIITWRGRSFVYRNGVYAEATVYNAPVE